MLRVALALLMLAAFVVPAHAEEPKQAKGSGLAELSIWQGINGLSLGIETTNARHGTFESGLFFATLGAAGGATIPSFAFPNVTTGQAMAINLGSQLGALNGVAVVYLEPDGSGGRNLALGQLLGTLGGAALAHGRPPEVGRMALAQSMALWLSVGTAIVQGTRQRDALLPATIAADVGAVTGYALWPYMPLSRGTLRAFDCGAGFGLVVGALYGASGSQHKGDFARAALAGLGVGVAVGVGITYLHWRTDRDAVPVSFHVAPTAGGALLTLGGPL